MTFWDRVKTSTKVADLADKLGYSRVIGVEGYITSYQFPDDEIEDIFFAGVAVTEYLAKDTGYTVTQGVHDGGDGRRVYFFSGTPEAVEARLEQAVAATITEKRR